MPEVLELAPQQLQALAAAGPRPVLLDVREPWELALASARPAEADLQAIPMREIPQRLAEIDPDRPIVCLCHHGVRSLQVARFLAAQGRASVYNLSGGIDAWSAQVDPSVPRY